MSNVIPVDFRRRRRADASVLTDKEETAGAARGFVLVRSLSAIDTGLRGGVGRMRLASAERERAMVQLREALSDIKIEALMQQARNLAVVSRSRPA